jgi:hypothetical protein
MSQFGNISISYHPLYITNNNTYLKWYRSKKFIFICTISVLTLFTVGAILFKKFKNEKEKLINSTIITNSTLTSKFSMITTTTTGRYEFSPYLKHNLIVFLKKGRIVQ